MSVQTWLLFVSSVFFISATPGSNMLLAFQFGLNYGVRKTLYTLAGLSLGLFLLLAASLMLVGWLSQTAPLAFEGMKLLASLYLAYLGVEIWRSASAQQAPGEGAALEGVPGQDGPPSPDRGPSRLALFRTGVAVSLSNPKAILFFAALFPKFLDPSAPLWPQYLILTISFFVIETLWQLIYTGGGKVLARWLSQGRRLMWLNRFCAAIFVFLAVGMLWDIVRALI